MNKILAPFLKYKRTRQWLIFWVATFSIFYIASLLESGAIPDQDVYVGWSAFLLLIYCVYAVFCFFRTIYVWFADIEDIEYGYSKKFDPKLRAPKIIRDLEDQNLSPKKIEKLEHELSIILKEYKSIVGSRETLEAEREKQLQKEARKLRSFLEKIPEEQAKFTHGSISSKIKCPHCHEVGGVRRKVEKNIEESREKGIVGAVIGKKMITDKGNITKFYCENCETPWTA